MLPYTHFCEIWSLNSWKLLVTPFQCICSKESTSHQGWPEYNWEAYQESRGVWQICQSLTLSVSLCVFSTVCISPPHYLQTLALSLSYFSFTHTHMYKMYHCYRNVSCNISAFISWPHIFNRGRYLEPCFVLLLGTEAHRTLTEPVDYEECRPSCFRAADRILSNKFNDAWRKNIIK